MQCLLLVAYLKCLRGVHVPAADASVPPSVEENKQTADMYIVISRVDTCRQSAAQPPVWGQLAGQSRPLLTHY